VKTIVVNIYICGSVNTPNVKFNSIKLQNSSFFDLQKAFEWIFVKHVGVKFMRKQKKPLSDVCLIKRN